MHGTSTISPGSTTPTTPVSSPWSWQEQLSSTRSALVVLQTPYNIQPNVSFFFFDPITILLTCSPGRVFVVLCLSILLRDAPGHQGHGGRVYKLRGHRHELPGLSHHPQTSHQGQWQSMQSGCAQLSIDMLCISLRPQCIYIFAHLAFLLLKLTCPIFHTNDKSKTQDRIGA